MPDYKKVTHKCWLYWLLIIWFKFWHRIIHFRQVKVVGLENLRVPGAKIFNPNHPNSFIDDISVLTTNRQKTVIVGHAGLFSNKLITKFLIFFRLLPAFRREDGLSNVCKNHGSFEHAVYAMEQGFSLLIFPEAQHTGLNSLLPLRKGAVRIAFLYADKHGFEEPVYLVPTTLYYTDFFRPRGRILIKYGTPINILEFRELYHRHPSRAIAMVRDELESRIRVQVVDIDRGPHYSAVNFSRDVLDSKVSKILGKPLKDVENKYEVDKYIVSQMNRLNVDFPGQFQALVEKIEKYRLQLQQTRVSDELMEKEIGLWRLILRTLASFVILPLYLVLLVNFSFSYFLSEFITVLFPDNQDKASVRFVAPMVFVPLWVIGEVYVYWKKVNLLIIKFLYVLFWPVLYTIFLDSGAWLGQTYRLWKVYLYDEKFELLKILRNQIIEQFSQLLHSGSEEKIFVDY